MERRNAWLSYKEAEETEMEKLAKAYREFLDKGKTERECVAEIVKEAEAAGYDFDTDFISASDEDTKKVSKDDVLADDNNKVVIIKANVDVKVDGTILYVSKENTKVTEKNKVSITGEGSAEEAALTYIIYK